MKTSGVSDRSQGATKSTAPRAKVAATRPGSSSGTPAATKAAPGKVGSIAPSERPAAKAGAKPSAKDPSGKPPAKELSGKPPAKDQSVKPPAKDPPAKEIDVKEAAARKPSGKPGAPVERPAPAQPAAVNAESLRSVTAPSSEPAAAPPPPAKPPAKPQIETHQIVTAPANNVDAPPPAPAPAAPTVLAPVLTAAEPVARIAEGPRPGGTGAIAPGGRPATISRSSNKDESFSEGDYVVYPTHGVGKVEKIAKEEIAGHHLELIHITFEENRMTLRVPVAKARSAGLRRLSTRKAFDEALAVLKGRARIKRTMWSRRAQEYEAKINSGDPSAIAEVVRDLHRNAGQPDQSFSERQIYEAAMDRLAAELAALDETDKATALVKLGNFLKTL